MGSKMITLFAEPVQSRSSSTPSTFVISMILHGALLSLVTTRLIENHRIIERFSVNRFAVRRLDFHNNEPQARQAAGGGIAYHGPLFGKRKATLKPAPGQGSAAPSMSQQSAQLMPAPQTLLQPDLPSDVVTSKKIPVPLTVIWSPEKTQPVKKVVLPTPEKASIALVRPTLETPIKEETLSDLHLSSTAFVTQGPAVPPSTTSPIVVHGPEQIKKAPETTSKPPDHEAPTPAKVISLSDVRVAEGTVIIPKVNESSSKISPGTMVPGQLRDLTTPGTGDSASKSNDAKAGQGSGSHPGNGEEASSANSGSGAGQAGGGEQDGKAGQTAAQASMASAGTNLSATGQSGAGSGSGSQPSVAHISLPRDGQFGVVVTGSSIEESYPETAELWSGRMAATVYLHVGMAKSWILQYALPRLEDAASTGGRLEAPWPYDIMRPNLDTSEMDTDAVILHGFVNKDGRFEKLAVVFPERFVETPMMLNALNQWQFRPAKQNGQAAPVEVLLIVPDQSSE